MTLLHALLFGGKAEGFHRKSSPSPPSSPPGPLASVSVSHGAEHQDEEASPISPALVEAEEILFRLWWQTLPNKTMARQDWDSELAYYGAQKGLSKAFLNALKAKVQDLR